MKKIVLIAVVLVAGFASQAQIKFGAKLGANLYSIGGSDAEDAGLKESRKMKIGIAGGAIVNIPVSTMFSVQPELLYSMEGNLQKEDDAKVSINLSYLNIPIMAQLNTTSGFYAETGPQIGFLMSAKSKFDDGTDEDEIDIKDELKSIGFSWALGAGYKMKSGFGIGARYNFGLSSLDDSDDALKITSSGFHVGVFYLFGGDKK
jgi:hypothetical protein